MVKAITDFLDTRKNAKLEAALKGKTDQLEIDEIKHKLEEKFEPKNWIVDAAKRSSQLKIVTHPGKYSHPRAKVTAINYQGKRSNDGLLRSGNIEVGLDVVGNAAALDVYSFLNIELECGGTLLSALQAKQQHVVEYFKTHGIDFEQTAKQFLTVFSDSEPIKTDGKVSQVYFPVDDDYHLLSVLTPSGILVKFKECINDIRFSENAESARECKKKNEYSEHGYRDIFDLTEIGYGGTKHRNISQANIRIGGKGLLLRSMPPALTYRKTRFPKRNFFQDCLYYRKYSDLFNHFGRLMATDINNINICRGRDRVINCIIDEIIAEIYAVRSVEVGWSQRENYQQLPMSHKVLLDNLHSDLREDGEWQDEMVSQIGRWIIFAYEATHSIVLGDEELAHLSELVANAKDGLL